MYHPDVIPGLFTVYGHKGEVHPAIVPMIDHGSRLVRAASVERRPAVIRAVGLTLGRTVTQTESATVVMDLHREFRPHGKEVVKAFHDGKALKKSSRVDVAGFLAWDGSPLPAVKKPVQTGASAKPVSVSPEAITAPLTPEDRRTAKATSEAAVARREASRRRAVADDASEDDITIAVADALRTGAGPDVFWFHVPNGGYRSQAIGAKFKAMGVRAGVPDFVVIRGGKVYGLELKKARGGTVSAEQKQAHAEMQTAGAVVAVARGFDEAIHQLCEWKAIN